MRLQRFQTHCVPISFPIFQAFTEKKCGQPIAIRTWYVMKALGLRPLATEGTQEPSLCYNADHLTMCQTLCEHSISFR